MKTFSKLATGAVMAAVAFPTAAVATEPTPDTTTPSASQQCKTLRTQMGATTFGQTYGTNANRANAFGKCVSKLNGAADAAKDSAAAKCKAEQTAGEAAFTAKYGTGKKGANAFGKCVSGQAKTTVAKAVSAELSASKTCKAERAAGVAAFVAKYGTNKNKSNAFGKCVSAKAKAKAAATS